jgi:putative addiction module killer protein
MGSIIEIKKTSEFEEWYEGLRDKEQMLIDARLQRIENAGHFGDAKYLGDGLAELRWKNGWRVYFFKESLVGIILLIGGSKNAQEKDIQRARLLLRRYADVRS